MNLKALLDEAKNSLAVLRHELLLSNGADIVHCFFEGQTDESFYGAHIRPYLKIGQKITSHFCGNKDAVYNTFSDLHSKIKAPTLGLFFVDKDIDDLVPVGRISHPSIHVTETYSVENYLADVVVIERVIGELFRLGSGHRACTELCEMYHKEYEKCSDFLLQLMAWILFHRRNGQRPNLNNIKLEQLCGVNDQFQFWSLPFSDAITSLDKWTQAVTPPTYLADSHPQLLTELKLVKRESVLRGKFVLWFVVVFLRIIRSNIAAHEPSRTINVEISVKTAIDLLGPRCPTPASLSTFLARNFAMP